MSSQTRSVTLNIAGQRLSLRTDRDDQFLHDLSSYVEDLVLALKRAAPRASDQQVSLLVALQLADELFAERANSRALCEEVNRRSTMLLELVDRELGESPPSPPQT